MDRYTDSLIEEEEEEEGNAPPGSPVAISEEDLNGMTVAMLKDELVCRMVYFPSRLRKSELQDLLRGALDQPVVQNVSASKRNTRKKQPTTGDTDPVGMVEKELPWDQHHPARKLLLSEIEANRIPASLDEMGPAEVYCRYHETLEFQIKGMEYGNKFTGRLRSLRKSVLKDQKRSKVDLKALKIGMKLNPLPPLNHRGQRHWNGSVAQALLQHDMSLGKHKSMTPSKLRMDRVEYQAQTSIDQFRWKVQQEIRTQKYLYTLEFDAEKKLKDNMKKIKSSARSK